MIEGVALTPLQRIPDERGTIFHMLKSTDEHFEQFGEVYFSSVYPGVVKGWHLHHEMTLNYACIVGHVKIVLYDDRAGSSTRGELMEIVLGPASSYALLTIPADVWNGFVGLGSVESVIANCATQPHDPSRTERRDPMGDDPVAYDWGV